MSELESTRIAIQDLQAGVGEDILADADVIIAVDVDTQDEEVVRGREDWEGAAPDALSDLSVLMVELDMESDDLEWLIAAAARLNRGEASNDDDFDLGLDD